MKQITHEPFMNRCEFIYTICKNPLWEDIKKEIGYILVLICIIAYGLMIGTIVTKTKNCPQNAIVQYEKIMLKQHLTKYHK